MSFIRSVLHMLWMVLTVIPWATVLILVSIFVRGDRLWWVAAGWLRCAIFGARFILGIKVRVTGMEHLPVGKNSGAILLVKHQSTLETFLLPALMPHPLAFVFKKELLYVPFFGWSRARLDMIHIDRSLRARANGNLDLSGNGLSTPWRKTKNRIYFYQPPSMSKNKLCTVDARVAPPMYGRHAF